MFADQLNSKIWCQCAIVVLGNVEKRTFWLLICLLFAMAPSLHPPFIGWLFLLCFQTLYYMIY